MAAAAIGSLIMYRNFQEAPAPAPSRHFGTLVATLAKPARFINNLR
jgi:hypothetical protein